MSMVAEEQQGYEYISPVINISHFSVGSIIFRLASHSWKQTNLTTTWTQSVPDLCPSPEPQFCRLAHLQPEVLRRAVVRREGDPIWL